MLCWWLKREFCLFSFFFAKKNDSATISQHHSDVAVSTFTSARRNLARPFCMLMLCVCKLCRSSLVHLTLNLCCLIPEMDWPPIQGVPCLSGSAPAPMQPLNQIKLVYKNGWMDKPSDSCSLTTALKQTIVLVSGYKHRRGIDLLSRVCPPLPQQHDDGAIFSLMGLDVLHSICCIRLKRRGVSSQCSTWSFCCCEGAGII